MLRTLNSDFLDAEDTLKGNFIREELLKLITSKSTLHNFPESNFLTLSWLLLLYYSQLLDNCGRMDDVIQVGSDMLQIYVHEISSFGGVVSIYAISPSP